MPKKKTIPAGTFLRLSLPDGTFGYARVLEPPYTAFYRYQTNDPDADLDRISSHPVAFIVTVNASAEATWEVIGHRDLEPDLEKPVVFFRQDEASYRNCTIYDSVGNTRRATPEECEGLERSAAWEDGAVKQRLVDMFAGRTNATVERLKPRLS